MRQLRITLLTTSDFPYRGAAESFVRQLTIGLKNNKASIEIIRFWGDRFSNINDVDIFCSNYLFKKPFKNAFSKIFETICQILFLPLFFIKIKLFKKSDVLLIYGLDVSYILVPVFFLSKAFGIKCFRIITEIYLPYKYAYCWWRKPLILFYNSQLMYFDRYFDGIIVLTKRLYQICVANKVRKENLTLIPHFIDVDNVNKQIGDDQNSDTDRICYCGNPTYENGILDLVDAYLIVSRKKTNTELVIIGDIKPEIYDKIANKITCKANITFTGLITKLEVNRYIQKCTVMVNPRKSGIHAETGFPTKLGEYFANKKPVISTKVGDLLSYFKDKRELIFANPDDPISLSEAICYVLNNKAEAQAIALNGYNWASDYLDYNKNSKKLLIFLGSKLK
ncbi:Glycosyltransferase involved in cell wall bisynthesis [Desulfocicer vacuolatum DSM 3385]|uniref:Glycosyltransferase involved in cell wall bisynthesis n=1 Tax=Desulfocicer vacuolatum DSM 3385 TaxID=1121400 RepID=A0A1W1Z4X6_9BACT|nr:glycosyltransferase family 4 protein [Desulfocicer vacuolatum]SMC43424.1 Glycosyltransferase involved in cell wall bisynthesis [Desulfocicer vacuolatum DSM 3385]